MQGSLSAGWRLAGMPSVRGGHSFLRDLFSPRCTEHILQYFVHQLVNSDNHPKTDFVCA